MPPERTPRDWLVRSTCLLIACIIPVLTAYLVYFHWSTPALDCKVNWQTGVVLDVPQGSFADNAGLQPGDVIETVEGIPFKDWKRTGVENRAVVVRRGGQHLTLELAVLSLAAINLPHLLSAIVVALTFWGVGVFVYWRRPRQFEARLFFVMVQSVGTGLLFFLPFPDMSIRPRWMEVLSSTGFHLAGPLLVHFYLTFPIVLGRPRQRRRVLGSLYALMVVALACRLSSTDWGLRLTFLYNTLEIVGAIGILIYAYLRQVTPDGRRRLRLVLLGGLLSTTPSFFFYLVPTIAGSSSRMPDWMVGPFIITAPISYLLAIVRHNLFDIDRVLNRTIVYAILAFAIFLLYLGPFLLIYRLLPGDWLLQVFVVAGLTLLVGLGFDWTRVRVQRWVDRLFYGGWYDYPRVVETISDALARSIERAALSDVLTRQVPALMQLEPGHLSIDDERVPPATGPRLELPLAFQGAARGVWVVGRRRDGEEFTASDRRILNTLARQAEVTLGNVLLVEMLRRQLDEIRASRETLAQAQRQLLRSREEERARLARDLHDGPIQDLVGLNMQLGLLLAGGNAPVAEPLAEMRGEVRTLLTTLRQACAELRPPMLDTMGLGAALRVLAGEWSAQSGVALALDLPPDASLRALPGETAVNLYRLVQEALSNIARHAAARSASIKLQWQGDCLTVTIHDDGCGFVVPPTLHGLATQGHFGLVGMQERATLIGAQWSVESLPGQGTTVRIVV